MEDEKTQIFLAPRSNETSYKNFLSTIENGVDFSIVEPHLNAEGKKILGQRERLFVWGNKKSKETSWAKMNVGDYIFFYRKGELVHVGKLLFKQKSEDLGLSLWPPKKGEEPWVCIFFLESLQEVKVDIQEISELAGYSKGFIVQGFQPLNDEGVSNIKSKFGSIEEFIRQHKAGAKKPSAEEKMSHSEAELLLLKVGQILDYKTYTPDKSKEVDGEVLSEYVSQPEIPTRFITEEMMPHVKEIDVIWFEDDVPKYAFEIEHSTLVITGFQRLFQLRHFNTKLFIVSNSKNEKKFHKFLESDPYYKHREQINFRDYRELNKYFRGVSEFDAINRVFLK